MDGHTQWVRFWCVHGQRASPVTSERARDIFVQALLTHGGYEHEMNEVYRIQRQTGKELDWLMIHRIVLWEMIWREQAQREKLKAQKQAKGVLAPSQAARAVTCTQCGAADDATSQCRASFVHSDKGGWKGKGKGAIGDSLVTRI